MSLPIDREKHSFALQHCYSDSANYQNDQEYRVLVINSSQDMAKEITLQLTLAIPGCSIMYAPSIELAKWIIIKRDIDLVVSSPIMPDGNIIKLKPVLETMESPPDLVVVGNLAIDSAEELGSSLYEYSFYKRLGEAGRKQSNVNTGINVKDRIKTLGADLRNDLNNPLQEIVAMVFVAQSGDKSYDTTEQALAAIDQAAKNLAKVVSSLEDKIYSAVSYNS